MVIFLAVSSSAANEETEVPAADNSAALMIVAIADFLIAFMSGFNLLYALLFNGFLCCAMYSLRARTIFRV